MCEPKTKDCALSGSSQRKPATAPSRIFSFAEGFHNHFPVMNLVLDWWRRSNRNVSYLVVAEAEVKQKTCGVGGYVGVGLKQ